MRIIQLVESLACNNGTKDHIVTTHCLLKQEGYQVETWAGRIEPDIPEGIAVPLGQKYPEFGLEDILLLQFLGGGDILRRIPGIPCRKILIYHGMSPARLFEGYDYRGYRASIEGEHFLRRWADKQLFDSVLTFSRHHREELLAMGFPDGDITVLSGYPLETWKAEETPDPDVLEDFDDERVTILSVGEIAPDHRQQDTVQAFACYQKYLNASARLIFAGSGQDTLYGTVLKRYIEEAEIKSIFFMGQVSPAEMAALYQSADLLVCMSEQENLDLSLINAIRASIPILAYGTGSVRALLGDAGVILGQKNIAHTAKWIDRLMKDPELREIVLKAQHKRLKELEQAEAGKNFLDYIGWFVNEYIKNPGSADEAGVHGDGINRIDGTLYDICQLEMSRIGARMPVSREEYLLSVTAGQ